MSHDYRIGQAPINCGRVIACLLLLADFATADNGASIRIQLLDGRSLDGELKTVDAAGDVTMHTDGETVSIAMREVDWLLFDSPRRRVAPSGFTVRLTDGSFLPVRIEGGSESRIDVRHDILGRLKLPLERVREMAVGPQRSEPGSPCGETDDCALLKDGSAIHGIVTAVSDRDLVIQTDDIDHRIEWSSLCRLTLAQSDPRAAPPIASRVYLSDGSVLAATAATVDGDLLTGKTANELPFRATTGALQCIEPVTDRRTWLEEIQPDRYESIPMFDIQWPMRVGRSAVGGPLRVGGRVYRRGLGLHAACRIAWPLDRRYDRFRAAVAVDDDSGSMADARITIRLDDVVAYEKSNLQWKQPPSPIDVDVSGVRRMEIEIGFGAAGDTQDRVDLLNPRLIAPDRPD